jgi:hypothetical protein
MAVVSACTQLGYCDSQRQGLTLYAQAHNLDYLLVGGCACLGLSWLVTGACLGLSWLVTVVVSAQLRRGLPWRLGHCISHGVLGGLASVSW